MKYLFWFLVLVLAADLAGYCAWILSGQMPVDSFYVGALTNLVIKTLVATN